MESVTFQFKPSRLLALWVILSHLLAIGLVCLVRIPVLFKLFIICVLIQQFRYLWDRYAILKHRSSIIEIKQTTAGKWFCQLSAGQSATFEPIEVYLSRFLIILRIRLYQRIMSVVIPVDSLSHFGFRTLYIRLGFYTKLPHQKQSLKA